MKVVGIPDSQLRGEITDEVIQRHIDDEAQARIAQANFNMDTEHKLERLNEIPTREEMGTVVREAINEYFQSKGKMTFSFVVGASIFLGALAVIAGSFKALLGWAGFVLINKIPTP